MPIGASLSITAGGGRGSGISWTLLKLAVVKVIPWRVSCGHILLCVCDIIVFLVSSVFLKSFGDAASCG